MLAPIPKQHGIHEHSSRFSHFFEELCAAHGFIVFSFDHRKWVSPRWLTQLATPLLALLAHQRLPERLSSPQPRALDWQ